MRLQLLISTIESSNSSLHINCQSPGCCAMMLLTPNVQIMNNVDNIFFIFFASVCFVRQIYINAVIYLCRSREFYCQARRKILSVVVYRTMMFLYLCEKCIMAVKRFFLLLATCILGICAISCKSRQGKKVPTDVGGDTSLTNVEFPLSPKLPLVDTPSIYVGAVEEQSYALFIEESSDTLMKGHFLDLEHYSSDSIRFTLSVRESDIIFESDVDGRLPRHGIVTIDDTLVGDTCRLMGKYLGSPFVFDLYREPAYVVYDNLRYKEPCFAVDTLKDVVFAKVEGYWKTLPESDEYSYLLKNLGKTFRKTELDLAMDIYIPHDDTVKYRPLVMLIHGGSFFMGSKADVAISKWCHNFASMGYVAVSIEYRLGFVPSMTPIERAGYKATQDAHAAMRFMVSNREIYGIDTSMLFVGGASAGAITALNLAYMTDAFRPKTSFDGLFKEDLGSIDASGNDIKAEFSIKGVVDMWGAVTDIEMLDGKAIPVLAFHGDNDDIVPYNHDYPFTAVKGINRLMFNKMYGSYCIVERNKKNRVSSKLYTFKGYRHSPHVDTANVLNDNFIFITDSMTPFFRDIAVPYDPQIILDRDFRYYISEPSAYNVRWKAEGGLLLPSLGNHQRVVWLRNAPKRVLYVSGMLPRGVGFSRSMLVGPESPIIIPEGKPIYYDIIH